MGNRDCKKAKRIDQESDVIPSITLPSDINANKPKEIRQVCKFYNSRSTKAC